MLYSKHIQNSIRPQGNTSEQGRCYDNFSAIYDSNIMFTSKLKREQLT